MKYDSEIWDKLIQDCRDSGKSVSSWCKENGIDRQEYYYYISRPVETRSNLCISDDEKVKYVCAQIICTIPLKQWCADHNISKSVLFHWRYKLYKIPKYASMINDFEEYRRVLDIIRLTDFMYNLSTSKLTVWRYCINHNIPISTGYRAIRYYKVLTTAEKDLTGKSKEWLNIVRDFMKSSKSLKEYSVDNKLSYCVLNDWYNNFRFAGKIKSIDRVVV